MSNGRPPRGHAACACATAAVAAAALLTIVPALLSRQRCVSVTTVIDRERTPVALADTNGSASTEWSVDVTVNV